MKSYKTIHHRSRFEFEDRKSVFIGEALPVKNEAEALAFLESVKKHYPDARHHVYAYVVRENAIMRFSDDGEPQGTAGVPMLETIRKSGVCDCVVVVTRYFGGIMLGAGGLVRAYSHGAKIALDAGGIITMSLCKIVRVVTDYNFYGRLVPLICEEGGIVEDTQFTDNVEVIFRMPQVGASL